MPRPRRRRTTRGVALIVAAACGALGAPRDAAAQRDVGAGVRARHAGETHGPRLAAVERPSEEGGPRSTFAFRSPDDPAWRFASPRWAPAASALLPGAGQAMLDQDRFLPYLALEAYAWLQYAAHSREGSRQRDAYRRLARTVARSQFSATTPSGNWEYYERMEHYVESGVYDAVPGGTVQPEPDTTTFNGSVWLLARETFWEDPNVPPDPGSAAYASAIAFYAQRAVTPDYRWSWRDAQLEQDLFRRTIRRSNDYYRRAAQDAAVVIANHVLSTVDSYVTVRLRSRRGGGRAAGAPGGFRPVAGSPGGYDLTLRVPLPRR